jgi:hypothetical protein
MLAKLKKFMMTFLVIIIMTMGVVMYMQKRNHDKDVVKLHNKIAMQSKTVEVHKNAYEKATVELDDLESVLRTFEAGKGLDAKTIKDLRKLIKKRNEEILSTNRLALKWKKAYEAEAEANQTEEPTDPDDPTSPTRTKVSFEKDFGYLGVNGYTLTNPAYAWVKINQNRPLLLTMTVTQARDGHWSTYVTSSEDNVAADVKLSAVNPYLFKEKWYEKLSLDFGMDLNPSGIYPYAGLSYPIGPVYISGGLWGDTPSQDIGYYSTINYSWNPFAR